MPEQVTTADRNMFAAADMHQMERFGIDYVQTSALHMQSNVAVELLVRTL